MRHKAATLKSIYIMDIKNQQIIDYLNVSQAWMRKSKDNADTKLGYAITRSAKKVDKCLKPYKELLDEQQVEIDDTNIRNASVDAVSKVLIYDTAKNEQGQETRNYKYTAEALMARNKSIRAIMKVYEVKVEEYLNSAANLESPYYTTEVPEGLSAAELDAFTGIVIAPELA